MKDYMYGEADNDTRGGNDTLFGGFEGHKLGADKLHGGMGDDEMFGAAGNDRLFGEQGRDELSGGEGSDFLSSNGDGMRDVVVCGLGRDTAHFDKGLDEGHKNCEIRRPH